MVETGTPSRRTSSVTGSPLVVGVEHLEAIVCSLPTMPKRGASIELDAAVALALVAGDQRMQRRLEAERGGVGRDVVDDAVGDHEHAGDLLGRHVGEAGVEGREELRALVAAVLLSGLDHPDIDVAERRKTRLERAESLVGLRHALADHLRAGAVDDNRDDLLERHAILAHQRRIEQRQHDEREAERPQPDRALAERQTEARRWPRPRPRERRGARQAAAA